MPLWTEESLADRKANKVLRDDQKIRDLAKRDAVVWLMATPAGRHYVRWVLFEVTGVLSDPFSADPNLTAYACGVRAAGDAILRHLLKVNPEALSIILKEEDNDQRTRQQRIDEPTGDDDPSDGGPDATGERDVRGQPAAAEPKYD